jgi:galactokinase
MPNEINSNRESPVFTASATGRLDVMGGFADYSGSLVLQMPIANSTTVRVTLRDDFQCRVTSQLEDHETLTTTFVIQDLLALPELSTQEIHNFFQEKEIKWAAYVVGCTLFLHHQKKIDFRGADFQVQSNVPLGKGVSSSAALEVATMKALTQAFQINLSGTELPTLAQKVENLIVGAPCGLMDQLASYFGLRNHLLPITCQPDLLHTPVSIPPSIRFIGIDSGVRHSVSGASYTDVRTAAFMGYSIIAQSLGVSHQQIQTARQSGQWKSLPYGGYLSNIAPEEFAQKFQVLLPIKISGKDFIKRYQTTTDSVTQVQPEKEYAVLNCTSHPIQENARVRKFKEILEHLDVDKINFSDLKEMGQLMVESHQGYTQCGLQSERTDEIVQLAQQAEGIYGAKITGGGSGGTVCLLTVGEVGYASAKKIHQQLELRYQKKLVFFG